MNLRKYNGSRLTNESNLQYAAFEAYLAERSLEKAYLLYMQVTPSALTSITKFHEWAATYHWQRRVNTFDSEEELRITNETRKLAINNGLSAEAIAKELYSICLEEIQLHRSEMEHRDIGQYLEIANKIGDKWQKKDPVVVVNQNQSQDTIEISEEALKELGKSLIKDES